MSDLLVPSTTLARKADTGENVKLEAKEIKNARIQDVPNYTADLFKMASAGFNLAYEVDKAVTTARAKSDYNDFKIKMDQYVTDLNMSNQGGMTNEELRLKIFDKMNEYANKNLLSKEYMDNPLIRNAILEEYNGYVDNISKAVYADNARKVFDMQVKTASSELMLAVNDASVAHNTSRGAELLDKAESKYYEMLKIQGISADSEIARAGWMKTRSAMYLSNALQDLEDPGWSPYRLRDKIKGMKGNMMIDDYTKAMRAINSRIKEDMVTATTTRQQFIDNLMMSQGHGSERDKIIASNDLALQYFEQGKNDPDSLFYGKSLADCQIIARQDIENDQALKRKQFSAETGFMFKTVNDLSNAKSKFTPEVWDRIVRKSSNGELDDVELVMVSRGMDPDNKDTVNERFQIQAELDRYRLSTNAVDKSSTYNDFSMLKYNIKQDGGVRSTSSQQAESDRMLGSTYTPDELTYAYDTATSAQDFGHKLGLVDAGESLKLYEKAQRLKQDNALKYEESLKMGLVREVTDKVPSKKIKSAFKDNPKMLEAAFSLAVGDDYLRERNKRLAEGAVDFTFKDYFHVKYSSGISQSYIDVLLTSPYLTDFKRSEL